MPKKSRRISPITKKWFIGPSSTILSSASPLRSMMIPRWFSSKRHKSSASSDLTSARMLPKRRAWEILSTCCRRWTKKKRSLSWASSNLSTGSYGQPFLGPFASCSLSCQAVETQEDTKSKTKISAWPNGCQETRKKFVYYESCSSN